MTIITVRGHQVTITEKQPDGAYTAWFGDYDLDCMTGWGKTPVAAVQDLFDKDCDANCSAAETAWSRSFQAVVDTIAAVMAEG